MLADTFDVVIGVDTHRDTHALALVDARTGAVLEERTITADPAGYRLALALALAASGVSRVWAIEGTGGYGAGLRRHLLACGEEVAEIDRPERRGERSASKSDALDAVRAARTLIARERIMRPRADGPREALRVLMIARESAQQTRVCAIRQIKAIVVTAPDALREPLRRSTLTALLRRCAALRPDAHADPVAGATASALRSLARRALQAGEELRALDRRLEDHVRDLAPALLAEHGVGPVTAAQLVISFSHPGRISSEAAFARLGGVAPIPASSGMTVRHRLDRGGDRRLNRALHTIVLVRRISHLQTRAYIERRVREGKSSREITRCLKRYVARHLFRVMEASFVAS